MQISEIPDNVSKAVKGDLEEGPERKTRVLHSLP